MIASAPETNGSCLSPTAGSSKTHRPSGLVRVNGDQFIHASAPFDPAVSALIWDEELELMIAQAISYPHLAHLPWIACDPLPSGLPIVTPQ